MNRARMLSAEDPDGPPERAPASSTLAARRAACELAADHVETDAERRFLLTHAYVHALEEGDQVSEVRLAARLRALGAL